jgi:hypothetical protein
LAQTLRGGFDWRDRRQTPVASTLILRRKI